MNFKSLESIDFETKFIFLFEFLRIELGIFVDNRIFKIALIIRNSGNQIINNLLMISI